MGRRLPVGLMLATAAAAAALNILVAYALARVLSGGQSLDLGPLALGAVALVGAGCALGAFAGWRQYLRRRVG